MALNPNTNPTMSGRITAPDANYPYGGSKDETSPGAGDGTPYFKARADDIFGFQQALLAFGALVPTGNADTGIASQYLQMIIEASTGRASRYVEEGTSAADAYVVDLNTGQQGPATLFDGMEVSFNTAFDNTGASTIDVSLVLGESIGTTIVNIKLRDGTNPLVGEITGTPFLRYNVAAAYFELANPLSADASADFLKKNLTNEISVGYTSTVDTLTSNTIVPNYALASLKIRAVTATVTLSESLSSENGACDVILDNTSGSDRAINIGAGVEIINFMPAEVLDSGQVFVSYRTIAGVTYVSGAAVI